MNQNEYPKRGWNYLYMEDTLGNGDGLYETCDFCNTLLRYKHYIEHPEGFVIGVGCQCCDMLTQEYTATTNEAEYKRDLLRIRTLINSTRWKQRKNGSFITYHEHKIIVWNNQQNGYCLQIQKMGFYGYYYVHRSYHQIFNKAVATAYYYIKKSNIINHYD